MLGSLNKMLTSASRSYIFVKLMVLRVNQPVLKMDDSKNVDLKWFQDEECENFKQYQKIVSVMMKKNKQ